MTTLLIVLAAALGAIWLFSLAGTPWMQKHFFDNRPVEWWERKCESCRDRSRLFWETAGKIVIYLFTFPAVVITIIWDGISAIKNP